MSKTFSNTNLVEYMKDVDTALVTALGDFEPELMHLDYSGDGGGFGCLAVRLGTNVFATIASGPMDLNVSPECDLRAWDIETLNAPNQMSEPVGVLFLTFDGEVPTDVTWDDWLCEQDYNQNEHWEIQECVVKSFEEAARMLNKLSKGINK